jgi:PAS domain S-box-containing protein
LIRALEDSWRGDPLERILTVRALNKLLDLDLAIIEDAYQSEYAARQQRTERLAAKERSEAAFRTLVEAAPCMIVIFRLDFSIVYFSRFAEELTGCSLADVQGENFLAIFVPGNYQSSLRDRMQKVLEEKSIRGLECPIICKDGSPRWMICNAQYLRDYEDGPGILFVGHDVTALKQAENQVVQAERLAAIGQMMTGLAHESGNALARSQACLEMLSLEVEDRPEALDLVARIQKAQNALQQLYEEVRGYAAPLKLDVEQWDLSGIWRQAWSDLAMVRQERGAVLQEKITGMDLRCSVDQFRMVQVFRNMFENSLAACAKSAIIEISCSEAKVRGKPGIRIRVQDNGPGLTAEQKARIFEPFYTTKTKGTGLGMPIAKRIVEAHGGTIEVGNGPRPGAEIIVALPQDGS